MHVPSAERSGGNASAVGDGRRRLPRPRQWLGVRATSSRRGARTHARSPWHTACVSPQALRTPIPRVEKAAAGARAQGLPRCLFSTLAADRTGQDRIGSADLRAWCVPGVRRSGRHGRTAAPSVSIAGLRAQACEPPPPDPGPGPGEIAPGRGGVTYSGSAVLGVLALPTNITDRHRHGHERKHEREHEHDEGASLGARGARAS
ncbi:hypothetical protein BC628DRAFT_1014506 [Trametes gibbosa]|nr:hypothetical protein BC628DRAFT_1014506 [Trametes gibbosa]